jgi:hypothetical protein
LKKEYLIEVVIESNICDSSVFTEKTMRGFYTGKPFVLFSGAYALKNLNSFGFKTFHPVINESYDTIENTEDRFNAVCKEIGRLAEIPNHELQSIFDHLLPVFEHNQNVFFENSHSWKNYKLPNLLYKSKYNW